MDLTNMIPGGAGEEQAVEQRLSKEEYAAMKKQQREEVWAEVDAQAQAVFQNGESLKGFLDFMAQCNTQKNAQPSADLRTESTGNRGKVL